MVVNLSSEVSVKQPRTILAALSMAGVLFATSSNANADVCNTLDLTAVGARTLASASIIASSLGITVVTHSSGALIATGSAGYIAGTLGTVSTTALAAVSSPIVIIGSSAVAVAAGGAAFYCYVKK
jgi:lambda repressor-like predicted transcriptional regulator